MRLPPFNKHGTFTKAIELKWSQFQMIYSDDKVRKAMINNAKPGFELLKAAGVETVYIGGSFASNKKTPSDIDGVFILEEHFNEDLLPDDFLEVLANYGMDFYPADMPTNFNGKSHLDFFKEGRHGEKPGLIKLSLKDLKSD